MSESMEKNYNHSYNKLIPILIMLAASISIASIDIYIPCGPYLADYFFTSNWIIKFSLMISPIVSAFFGIIYGHFIDLHGRRLGMLLALIILAFGSIICACTYEIYGFLCARFIQALGTGGLMVTGIAILADMFTGVVYARYLATYSLLFPITFAAAPIIGAFIFEHAGWRWVFLFLGIISSLILAFIYKLLPETKKTEQNQQKWFDIFKKTKSILHNSDFLILGAAHALPVATSAIFTTSSAFVYIVGFNFSPIIFSYLQLIPILFNVIGSLLYRQQVVKWGLLKSLRFGSVVMATFMLTCAISLLLSVNNPWVILAIMCILNLSLSSVISTCATKAFDIASNQNKGLAVALVGFFRNILVAAIVLLSGVYCDSHIAPVFVSMIICTIINLWLLRLAYYRL